MKSAISHRLASMAPTLAAAMLAADAVGAAPASHSFDITYRDFGPVASTGGFHQGEGYQIRFEGCFAKKSAEAICGFTLRSTTALKVSNGFNLSHGTRTDGAPMRTCCMFVQGRNTGYPIITTGDDSGRIAILQEPLEPGKDLGMMLRLPDYAQGAPLKSITFSRGANDPGATFPAHVQELP